MPEYWFSRPPEFPTSLTFSPSLAVGDLLSSSLLHNPKVSEHTRLSTSISKLGLQECRGKAAPSLALLPDKSCLPTLYWCGFPVVASPRQAVQLSPSITNRHL